ncbi:hypothetical protein POP12_158 [Pectobacterium phage POP12]|nr:hypothetical protein POP12_158 [Pectobacterium phage POP12]
MIKIVDKEGVLNASRTHEFRTYCEFHYPEFSSRYVDIEHLGKKITSEKSLTMSKNMEHLLKQSYNILVDCLLDFYGNDMSVTLRLKSARGTSLKFTIDDKNEILTGGEKCALRFFLEKNIERNKNAVETRNNAEAWILQKTGKPINFYFDLTADPIITTVSKKYDPKMNIEILVKDTDFTQNQYALVETAALKMFGNTVSRRLDDVNLQLLANDLSKIIQKLTGIPVSCLINLKSPYDMLIEVKPKEKFVIKPKEKIVEVKSSIEDDFISVKFDDKNNPVDIQYVIGGEASVILGEDEVNRLRILKTLLNKINF